MSVPDSSMLIALAEELDTTVSALLGEKIQDDSHNSIAEEMRTISEKPEIINLQLARSRMARVKTVRWALAAICALIAAVFVGLAVTDSSYLGWRRRIESQIIRDNFADMSYSFAQNYDSPCLFYPITSPHGTNKSGIVTYSRARITDSLRRSFPVQDGFKKILDLDRCFNVTRIPADDGRELVLINAHLSAYTTDPTVNVRQLEMIYTTMQEEYEAGNYVICGGDFNKDLLGDSSKMFEGVALSAEENWCTPFPVEDIPDGISLVAAYDKTDKVPSCRNADIGYEKGKTFVCTVDGFLVTDNVKVNGAKVQNSRLIADVSLFIIPRFL